MTYIPVSVNSIDQTKAFRQSREINLQSCKVCKHKLFDPERGIVCRLTLVYADFEGENCEYFILNAVESDFYGKKRKLQVQEDRLRLRNAIIGMIIGVLVFISGLAFHASLFGRIPLVIGLLSFAGSLPASLRAWFIWNRNQPLHRRMIVKSTSTS